MDLPIDPVFGFTSRLLLVLVFGVAVGHKLAQPRRFVAILREYRLLPDPMVAPAAVLVICAEVFAVTGIWWEGARTWAAAGAVALLAAYGVAIGINLRRGRLGIDCGCSFGASQQLSPALLVRNALLALPCAAAGLPASHALGGAGFIVSILGALALWLIYQVWGALVANGPRMLQLEGRK